MREIKVARLIRRGLFEHDAVQVARLLDELSPWAAPHNMDLRHLVAVIKSGSLFVARSDGRRIVGMATLSVCSKPSGTVGVVEDVVVAEEFRGQGIAKKLMGAVNAWGRKRGVGSFELTSNPSSEAAHKLYIALGYEVRHTTCFRLKI